MTCLLYTSFERLLEFDEGFLERAGECGHRSFTILAGALEGLDIVPEKLSYEGPFGVGYGLSLIHIYHISRHCREVFLNAVV